MFFPHPKPEPFISFSLLLYHDLFMTSSSPVLRSIITGFFILVILVISLTVIFPVATPVQVPVPYPAPVSPHAFVVTRAEVPPIEAFQNVTLYKLMSPARAQEKAGTYPTARGPVPGECYAGCPDHATYPFRDIGGDVPA